MSAPCRPCFIAALSVSAAACAEWPRFAHLPAADTAVQATGDSGAAPEPADVSWADAAVETEPNDTPGAALALALNAGLRITGDLDGVGWDDAGVPPATDTGCASGVFPPASPGYYSGDVDWVSVLPAESGTLCATLRFDSPPDGLYVDLLPYSLDACAAPEALLLDLGTGQPAGVSLAGDGGWSVAVLGSRATAIALAGFLPRDSDNKPAYTLDLALLPATSTAACPTAGAR